MTRTNKMGIARKKNTQAKAKKLKNIDMRPHWKKIAKMNIDDKKNNWYVKPITDPTGKTYLWYTKGRKVCLETNLKINPNGYGQYSGRYSQWLITPRLKKKLHNQI